MDLLFARLTPAKVRYCMVKACALAGVPYHKVHTLRYRYAEGRYDALRAQGYDDHAARLIVSRELGHNRPSVTYAYKGPVIRPGWRR